MIVPVQEYREGEAEARAGSQGCQSQGKSNGYRVVNDWQICHQEEGRRGGQDLRQVGDLMNSTCMSISSQLVCSELPGCCWHYRSNALMLMCSVTTAEIVDAIFKQTGRELEKKDIELPEISKLGTYTASIRLHPEVVGTFNVVVQREKNA